MQKIDRDRLDENTGQIECGEEIGTVFLIDKETAITVKHCLLIEKPETYAKNAVLHFSVKDEEKTVKASIRFPIYSSAVVKLRSMERSIANY